MTKRRKQWNESVEKGLFRRDFLKLAGMGLAASSGLGMGLAKYAFGAGELARSQKLKMGTISGDIVAGMDPMMSVWDIPWLHFLYGGLMRMKVGDESLENLEPDIATSYTISDDKTVYTFKLRKGVKFHKGYGECTAEDVLFTFDRLKNDVNSAVKGKYQNIDKLEAPDDYTFRVHAKKPDYFFIRNLIAYKSAYVVSKKAVKDLGDKFKTNPVGTGAFQFKEYRSKDRVIFVRHDEYFRGRPILEQIDWIFMPNMNTRIMALQTGEVDAVRSVRSGDIVQRLKSAGLVMDGYRGSHGWVFLNLYHPIFKNKLVRKALFYATDRQAIADYFGDCGHVLWGMFSPQVDGAKKYPDRYHYNLDKAKELLKEAGYPNGFSFSTFISKNPKRLHTMEMVQQQWSKVNVKMDLTVMEHAASLHKMWTGAAPAIVQSLIRTDMDELMLLVWGSGCYKEPTATQNLSCYGHACPGVDDLILKARATFDRAERNAIYARIQDKLMEDVPMIPVYDFENFHARQHWLDLGYKFKKTFNYCYRITEKTRLLKH